MRAMITSIQGNLLGSGIFLIIFLTVSGASAQKPGLRLGVNFSHLNSETGGVDHTSRIESGVDIGLFLEYELSVGIDFIPALHFIQKGGEYEIESPLGEREVRLDYIECSPGFHFGFSQGRIRPFLLVAPHVAWAIGGEENDGKVDFDAVYRRLDYGVSSGLGLGFLLDKLRLDLDIRYHYGLANYQKEDGIKTENRSFNIGLSIGLIQ